VNVCPHYNRNIPTLEVFTLQKKCYYDLLEVLA